MLRWVSWANSPIESTRQVCTLPPGETPAFVSVRLEGDFPGGVADLDQRFTVREGEIAGLVIA
jgi:hypothetical protein